MLRRQFEFGRTGCALEAQRLIDTSGRASAWEEKGIEKFKTSQASDVGSIPIARSINPDDSVALTLLNLSNETIKQGVLVPRWSQLK